MQPEVSFLCLKHIESDVERYFKQFGNVVDVAIMRDKNNGRSRGFAFVTFRERTKRGAEILN
jgi:cold-inducible RNA-binding protein